MKEIWKDVPGYKGYYQVSNYGNVMSMTRIIEYSDGRLCKYYSKLKKQTLNSRGYYSVFLYGKYGHKNILVHQLVAMAFLGYIRNGKQDIVVDHIDNDKLNNKLDNLQLITNRQNLSKDKKGSSKYTGVHCCNKKYGYYAASIKVNGVYEYLGMFKNEIDASNAYQKRLKEIK